MNIIIVQVKETQVMEDNYAKAYKEITEILKYVPIETANKIPQEMRDMFKDKQSKTYNFKIDTSKSFEEQELLEETKAILSNIFRDYLATDYQKAKILEIENEERLELEKEKREKYNPDNLFKKQEKVAMVEYKKYNLFGKIKNFIQENIKKLIKILNCN